MAVNRRYHIHTKAFSEYMYRIMKNAGAEQKKDMQPNELAHFKDERSINLFVLNEPFEKLLLMATKMGYDWTLLVSPDDEATSQILFNTYNQYAFDRKRIDVTEATARENVCAVSSREVMVIAHMCAQNCQTAVYHLSEYSKDILKRVPNYNKIETHDETIARASGAYNDFAKILLEAVNSFDYVGSTLSLQQDDIRILLAMFVGRNSVLDIPKVSEMTKLGSKKKYVGKHIAKMEEMGLLYGDRREQSVHGKTIDYILTTKGIKVVMDYISYVHKQTFMK